MWWRRKPRPEPARIDGPATRVPDNDTVLQPGYRRWSDLLNQRTELMPLVDPPVVSEYLNADDDSARRRRWQTA
jgi:hypothetical protein